LTNGKEDTPNIALSHSDHHETRKDGAILRIDEIYKNRLHHLHFIGELSLAISMDINAVYESVAQFVVQESKSLVCYFYVATSSLIFTILFC
jgi:hypothetical protein